MFACITMSQQVSFQVRSLVETLVADWAFMRRFFHMQNFMHRQCSRLAESFATLGALKWLLLRMNIPEKTENKNQTKETLTSRGENTTKHIQYKQTPKRLIIAQYSDEIISALNENPSNRTLRTHQTVNICRL